MHTVIARGPSKIVVFIVSSTRHCFWGGGGGDAASNCLLGYSLMMQTVDVSPTMKLDTSLIKASRSVLGLTGLLKD